jgi:hypothetical protein
MKKFIIDRFMIFGKLNFRAPVLGGSGFAGQPTLTNNAWQ